jgi:hypothetical protein
LVILVVFPEESRLRDFVTRSALIPLFSRPWSLLQFQSCRDHLALPAPAFVSYSAFVLLMVKYRLGHKGSEWVFHAP